MIWSINDDDIQGLCGEKYVLLKTLNRVLRNYEEPVTVPSLESTTEEPHPETTSEDLEPVTDASTISTTSTTEIPTDDYHQSINGKTNCIYFSYYIFNNFTFYIF